MLVLLQMLVLSWMSVESINRLDGITCPGGQLSLYP